MGAVDTFAVGELFGVGDQKELLDQLGWLIGGLKRLAGGSTSIMREMRELDNRLGLNPKAMADLRWTIEADGPSPSLPDELDVRRAGRERRLQDPLDALDDGHTRPGVPETQ